MTKNRDSKFTARKMSGAVITSTTATKNNLSSWAEDNNIPIADIARAYNLSTTAPHSTKTSAEAVAISEADPSRSVELINTTGSDYSSGKRILITRPT